MDARLSAARAGGDPVPRQANVMGSVEWLLLVMLSVLWGGSFFFSKVALEELPPFTVVLGRVGLAAVALNLIVIASGQRMPRSTRRWGAFLAMGALNNLIPFSLIFWGQTQIASGLASILNATTPLFTVLLAHLLTRDERLTTGKALGVVCGMLGVTVMIGLEALDGLSLHLIGELAVVGAALSYGFASLFGRRFRGQPPLVTASGQVTATALMMLPVAAIADQPWSLPAPSPVTWGALAGLALLSTAVAYIIYFRILAVAGATNLVLVTFLIPVSALLLGTTILGERIASRHLLGMALIALGLAIMDGRLFHWSRRRGRLAVAPAEPVNARDGGT
jgi:drug/metabolite transporter (DMT)-like permease